LNDLGKIAGQYNDEFTPAVVQAVREPANKFYDAAINVFAPAALANQTVEAQKIMEDQMVPTTAVVMKAIADMKEAAEAAAKDIYDHNNSLQTTVNIVLIS